jgi:hypothetical protein
VERVQAGAEGRVMSATRDATHAFDHERHAVGVGMASRWSSPALVEADSSSVIRAANAEKARWLTSATSACRVGKNA